MHHDIEPKDVLNPLVLEKFRTSVRLERWGCLMWTSAKNNTYGAIRVAGRSVPAHRVAWVLKHQRPIPDELVIDHLCCNKPCVNADHLDAVTDAENLRRVHRPPKGWEPVPAPVVEAVDYRGRRWVDVRWMTNSFGKMEKHYRAFDDPEEAAAFAAHLTKFKASATATEQVPTDIRTRLLKVYTEQGTETWLREPHRKLGGRPPLELIQLGKADEVRNITAWMADVSRVVL